MRNRVWRQLPTVPFRDGLVSYCSHSRERERKEKKKERNFVLYDTILEYWQLKLNLGRRGLEGALGVGIGNLQFTCFIHYGWVMIWEIPSGGSEFDERGSI